MQVCPDLAGFTIARKAEEVGQIITRCAQS